MVPNHVALVQEMAQPSALVRGPLHVPEAIEGQGLLTDYELEEGEGCISQSVVLRTMRVEPMHSITQTRHL